MTANGMVKMRGEGLKQNCSQSKAEKCELCNKYIRVKCLYCAQAKAIKKDSDKWLLVDTT